MDYAALIVEALPPRLLKRAERCFDGQDPAHDWSHNLRVMALCERIGREEGAEMTVLRLAALLHDIGRAEERRTKECHAQISARQCEPMLREEGYDHAVIEAVQKAILTHRWRKENPPQTLEEKILFDADKLDSIGAVGIGRAFAYSGVIGQPLQSDQLDQHTPQREFEQKLVKLKDRLFTPTARQIAEQRHAFMLRFFEQWEKELRGIS
ncbi:HD domain-containing protein [Brevibacillus humidisoli]|uniref:HD domain-containing protein n=1 Tax=Brevibacillus humidisoli TaxID=2895522 RepID=UPI001E59B17A|nr:HD domain-containing protein [Brevibacillus humidisoli]UFJ39999.1 HD domain-containing protein [Brevibacillus humidisoli]